MGNGLGLSASRNLIAFSMATASGVPLFVVDVPNQPKLQFKLLLIEALRERNRYQSADGCNSANDNKTGTKVHGGLQPGLSHRV